MRAHSPPGWPAVLTELEGASEGAHNQGILEGSLEKMRGRGAVGATSPRWLKWRKVKVKSLSRVRLFATSWTVAHQAPPSLGFSRQEYWSGLPFPSPGDLPNPGIEPRSPALRTDVLTSQLPGKPQLGCRSYYYTSFTDEKIETEGNLLKVTQPISTEPKI